MIIDSGISVQMPGAVVFNAAAPTSYTDLDLSGTVGARQVICVLWVQHASSGNSVTWRCRTNGETYTVPQYCASSVVMAAGNDHGSIVIAVTDSAGIIEHISSHAETVVITLLGYCFV